MRRRDREAAGAAPASPTPRTGPEPASVRPAPDRSADARKDRILKTAGLVLAAVSAGFLIWSGTAYLSGRSYSGELVAFEVVSAESVEAHVSVRKGRGTVLVCTLRSLSESGREVARKDVGFPEEADSVERHVQLRTTGRATAVELVGCQDAAAG
ncbi:DUF4307 domain-containing protein [Streptomyces sp. NPDC051211]|uniref:DUF4307 domain-containing protein n=1 Tax=Streptomyces sp. NPDC051211 TaxID=3154643 RepID=UPI00344FD9B2